MARVKIEAGSGIAGLSGRVGNLVFRMSADGDTYVQQAPAGRKQPGSAAQQAYRRKFGDAARYRREQAASAEGRAYYQPFVQPGRFGSVYRTALADFAKPPQVLAVSAEDYYGQAGEHLRIRRTSPAELRQYACGCWMPPAECWRKVLLCRSAAAGGTTKPGKCIQPA